MIDKILINQISKNAPTNWTKETIKYMQKFKQKEKTLGIICIIF